MIGLHCFLAQLLRDLGAAAMRELGDVEQPSSPYVQGDHRFESSGVGRWSPAGGGEEAQSSASTAGRGLAEARASAADEPRRLRGAGGERQSKARIEGCRPGHGRRLVEASAGIAAR